MRRASRLCKTSCALGSFDKDLQGKERNAVLRIQFFEQKGNAATWKGGILLSINGLSESAVTVREE